jgi:hypothetical protein
MANEIFEKVSVDDELPPKEGRYVVYTKTPMGNGNTFEITYHERIKKGNMIPVWGCNNQIVTHWLKEIK